MRAATTSDFLNGRAGSTAPPTANGGNAGRTSQENLDRLFLGVAQQLRQTAFLADARVLVAAVGRALEVVADAIDADHAGLHAASSLERTLDVGRPHRSGEPVLDRIGELDDRILV